MSLEAKIELLIAALEKNTAAHESKTGSAGTTEAPKKEVVKKAPPKTAPKTAPVDDLDLDLDDAPVDDLDFGDEAEVEEIEEVAAVTRETVLAKFKELAKAKGGREAVSDILKKFKAAAFGDLKESQYEKALAEANKALASK